MATIEHGQWQEVYEPQIDGNERGKEHELCSAEARGLARHLCDLHQSAHILDRPVAGQKLAEHLPRLADDLPRLARRNERRLDERNLLEDDLARPDADQPALEDIAKSVGFLDGSWRQP